MRSQRVETLEYEAAVIAKEFMKPDQQYHGVIVIALNPLALTSRAPHRAILARITNEKRYNDRQ
jgi:hypothetical protein